MISLLSELGKNAAARWLTALALPALLFTTILTCACLAAGSAALDPSALADSVTATADKLGATPGAIAVAGLAFLLVASAAGGLAGYLADAVVVSWVASRPRWWVTARRNHADKDHRLRDEYLPSSATPIGDDFQAAYERVRDRYGALDLTLIWPRLWLVISKDTREVVTAAYGRFLAAGTYTAWSLMYLAVGIIWWPALIAGVLGVLAGYYRAKLASTALATLLESVVDVHQKQLTEALGIALTGGSPIGRPEADAIVEQLQLRADPFRKPAKG